MREDLPQKAVSNQVIVTEQARYINLDLRNVNLLLSFRTDKFSFPAR